PRIRVAWSNGNSAIEGGRGGVSVAAIDGDLRSGCVGSRQNWIVGQGVGKRRVRAGPIAANTEHVGKRDVGSGILRRIGDGLLRFAEGSITIAGLEQQARVSRAGAGVGWVDVERALEVLNGGVVIATGEVPGRQAEVAGRIAWRGGDALLID